MERPSIKCGIVKKYYSGQRQPLGSFLFHQAHHCLLEAEPFSQTLLDDLAGWSNQAVDQGQQDDITLLVIDYKQR